MSYKKVWPSQIFGSSKLDYAYAHGLSKQEWAWEFLRRNQDYRRDYVTSRARLSSIAYLSNNIPLMRPRGHQSDAQKWGLACFSDPTKTAHQTPIFWSTDSLKQHVDATAVHTGSVNNQIDLDVFRQSTCIAILENKIGNNVLIRSGTIAIDLHIEGINVLLNPAALSFRIDGITEVKEQTEALKLLAGALQNTPPTNIKVMSKSARQNLLKALIALDCNQVGGSLQDTANLFRTLHLTRLSWSSNGDESLKKQVIRARNRGLKLVQGGYRNLLP